MLTNTVYGEHLPCTHQQIMRMEFLDENPYYFDDDYIQDRIVWAIQDMIDIQLRKHVRSCWIDVVRCKHLPCVTQIMESEIIRDDPHFFNGDYWVPANTNATHLSDYMIALTMELEDAFHLMHPVLLGKFWEANLED